MRNSEFSEEQIIAILTEPERGIAQQGWAGVTEPAWRRCASGKPSVVNGLVFSMGLGGILMLMILIFAVLASASVVKYLRN